MQTNNQINDNTNEKFLGEYFGQVRQTLIYLVAWGAFVILSSCLAGNYFLIPSFLLGFVSSLLYYILMCLRVKKSVAMPPPQAVAYMRLGWIIRLAFILAVVVIALKMPWIQFPAMLAGLFSLQMVIVAQAVVIVTLGLISRYKK